MNGCTNPLGVNTVQKKNRANICIKYPCLGKVREEKGRLITLLKSLLEQLLFAIPLSYKCVMDNYLLKRIL